MSAVSSLANALLPEGTQVSFTRAAAWSPGQASDQTPVQSRVQSKGQPDGQPQDESSRQSPEQPGDGLHGEVFASSREGAGAALALALALDRLTAQGCAPGADWPDERRWLWVQDRETMRRTGIPYRPGLPAALRHRLVHVGARTPEDALFALEEGVRCRDFAFVLGEVAGNPRALDFTASRRLGLAAERHGVPLWLVRLDAAHDLSAARMRWQAESAPSPRPRWNTQAPGAPAWRAELFRARNHPPGKWTLSDEYGRLTTVAPHPVDLAGRTGDRPLAAG